MHTVAPPPPPFLSLRSLLALISTFACLYAGVAAAQIPQLLGNSKGAEKPSGVRLNQSPAERIKDELDALLDQQKALAWTEGAAWDTELAQVRTRISELAALRERWVTNVPPPPLARLLNKNGRLAVDPLAEAEGAERDRDDEGMDGDPLGTIDSADRQPVADGGVMDAALPDAGVADAAVADAAVADAAPSVALDAGVPAAGDAGPDTDGGDAGDAGVPVDAAPPEPPPVVIDVVPYGEQFLTPGVHPDAVNALDQAVMALRQQERILVTVHRMLNEEAAQLAAGVGRAEALLQRLDQPPFDHDRTEPFGLRDVERLALDVHLARIEDALARARQREPIEDDSPQVDSIDQITSPPIPVILEPTAVYRASLTRAESLREEANRAENQAARLAPRLRVQRDAAERARTRRVELDMEFAQRDLAQREARFERARARMHVLPEEVEWTTKRLTRSKMLREEQTRLIESELDTLRAAEARSDVRVPVGDNDASVFTDASLREKRVLLTRERLTFERQKLLRDHLFFDLATHLNNVIAGQVPPEGVFEPYRDILDPKRNEERHNDLSTRCDGWRRASNTAENKRAGNPAQRELKEQLLEVYQSLTNLCMRHEWVLGTEDRLAEIARYHLDRLEWSARGVTWYLWRGLLSLFLLVVLVVCNRLLRRLTRVLAGARSTGTADVPKLNGFAGWVDRMKRMRGTFAMLAYLSVSVFCWLYAIILISRHVWTIPLAWHDLLGWSTATLFTVGDKTVSVWSIAQLLIWWFVGVWLARLIHGFVTQNILGHFNIDRGIRDAIGQVVRYLALFVTVALGLASVGIGLGALGLLFGVIGIGIGFGLQNIASNFISGFILLFERPIRRGDFVQVGDLVGEVKDISARATTLETRDAITVIVPNSEFVSGKVINWTLGSRERVRAQVKVGVDYESDLLLVEKLLLRAAAEHPGVLRVPAPNVQLKTFGDSSLDFHLNIWTTDIRNLPRIQADINFKIALAFRANGVTIPFPQRTLHLAPAAARVFGADGEPVDEGPILSTVAVAPRAGTSSVPPAALQPVGGATPGIDKPAGRRSGATTLPPAAHISVPPTQANTEAAAEPPPQSRAARAAARVALKAKAAAQKKSKPTADRGDPPTSDS